MPLAWTLDTLGVIARSAGDARAVLRALNGEPLASEAGVAYAREMVCGVVDLAAQVQLDGEVAAAFERMVSSARLAGVTIRPVKLDSHDVVAARRLCLLITEVEALVIHQAKLESDPEGFSPDLTARLRWASGQSAPRLAAAYRQLSLTAARIAAAVEGMDALLTPSTAEPAFAFGRAPPLGQADFTVLANIAGWAATAFPIGFSRDGLPLSAQVISASESTSLELAERLAAPFKPPAFQA